MAPSLLPSLPFQHFTRQLSCLPAQPERPYPITLHCHTRTLSPSSRSTVREKELRAAPEYVERPLCPAPLLPFCSFIAILHAQSADLADYADYGKYTQTQTSTHTHIHTLYRGTTLSWTCPCNPFASYNTFLW